MEDGLVNGPSSWSDFIKISFKSLGPFTRCKLNVTKKNDEGAHFLIHVQKRQFWKKKKSSIAILLSSLGFYLSSLLAKCVEDVACKSSCNNFYQKMSDLICTCSM